MNQLRLSARFFIEHLLALLLPGRVATNFQVHRFPPQPVDQWAPDELRLLIEEGRHQITMQQTRVDRIRSATQLLITTALALLVLIVSSQEAIVGNGGFVAASAWGLGVAAGAIGLLGAFSLFVVPWDLGQTDAANLTYSRHPVADLAASYAEWVRPGEDTIATKLSVYQAAVFLVLSAAFIEGLTWIATR